MRKNWRIPHSMSGSARFHDRRMTALVVDDHTVFRQGLVDILGSYGVTVLGEASDGRSGIEEALRLAPDVILMDVDMPTCNGIDATRAITGRMAEARVLMMTTPDDNGNLISAVAAGAKGYVLKTGEVGELIEAIDRVMDGAAVIPPHMAARLLDEFVTMIIGRQSFGRGASRSLTRREEDILCQLVNGASNEDIAAALGFLRAGGEHPSKKYSQGIAHG
jgi:two-component system NarL family response regulator